MIFRGQFTNLELRYRRELRKLSPQPIISFVSGGQLLAAALGYEWVLGQTSRVIPRNDRIFAHTILVFDKARRQLVD